jgi:chromosome segregation ATPase
MSNITIESIELVNFMCHENLKIKFNKLITCIGGRNGTGKSAIMIALGILFGQRASALERGNSYTELIKSGTNQSIIKVVINNYLNYKSERYGPKIIIEKRLRPNSVKMSFYNE